MVKVIIQLMDNFEFQASLIIPTFVIMKQLTVVTQQKKIPESNVWSHTDSTLPIDLLQLAFSTSSYEH